MKDVEHIKNLERYLLEEYGKTKLNNMTAYTFYYLLKAFSEDMMGAIKYVNTIRNDS